MLNKYHSKPRVWERLFQFCKTSNHLPTMNFLKGILETCFTKIKPTLKKRHGIPAVGYSRQENSKGMSKTGLLRVPWTARTSNQSIQKEINPEYLLEGLDAEAEVLIFWPPDPRSQLTGKGPDADEDWGQEKKGATEDEMVGWHHQLNGHEFEQIPGDGEGQGSLVCCSPWGCK